MATCKDCVHSGICYKEHNHHHEKFYYCDLENVEKECQHFINKSTIIDIPDDMILYVQDKWLVINMESDDIGKAMKSIVDYCKGGNNYADG